MGDLLDLNIDLNDLSLPEPTEKDRVKFPDITVSEKGNAVIGNTSDNLNTLITYLAYSVRYNMMTLEPEITSINPYTNVQVKETDLDTIRSRLISAASITKLPKIAIDDHLAACAKYNHFHPVKDYLNTSKWDGKSRLKEVVSCLNAESEQLAYSIFSKWLIGCVASLYEPKFKSKLVPILQGGQSFKKTAFIERIAQVTEHSFLEGAELNPDQKDSVLSCIKSWIVELGELERTSRNSQGSLKAFITKEEDTIRPPYGRSDIKKPRQTHFIATVNGDDFLKDDTGNSRYGVIKMNKSADIEKLNDLLGWRYDGGRCKHQDPEQLLQFWLEVKTLYDNGDTWMLNDTELKLTSVVNEQHRDKGSLYDYLRDNYTKKHDYQKVEWKTAGELVGDDHNLQSHQTRLIGKALTQLVKEYPEITVRSRGGYNQYSLFICNSYGDSFSPLSKKDGF